MSESLKADKPNALVIGSRGTIGAALVTELSVRYAVSTLSRINTDYSPQSLKEHAQQLSQLGGFERVVCCIGVLHDSHVSPEKSMSQIQGDQLNHYFHVNSILPMLCMQHFLPLMSREKSGVFACLSAMVGGISDNQLGGWYGYRSSKAALNMLVKTTAIEMARMNKQVAVVAVHPGTTVSGLSAPFARNVESGKYYTPEQSAARIVVVMDGLKKADSGGFYNWDGAIIPW